MTAVPAIRCAQCGPASFEPAGASVENHPVSASSGCSCQCLIAANQAKGFNPSPQQFLARRFSIASAMFVSSKGSRPHVSECIALIPVLLWIENSGGRSIPPRRLFFWGDQSPPEILFYRGFSPVLRFAPEIARPAATARAGFHAKVSVPQPRILRLGNHKRTPASGLWYPGTLAPESGSGDFRIFRHTAGQRFSATWAAIVPTPQQRPLARARQAGAPAYSFAAA